MKIIDLLNKIASGEEVPHVQYDDTEAYLGADGYLKDTYGDNVEWWINKTWLNTEVEIIEEEKEIEKKEIEELNLMFPIGDDIKNSELGGFVHIYKSNLVNIKYKIDEVIDELNELKKKVEDVKEDKTTI